METSTTTGGLKEVGMKVRKWHGNSVFDKASYHTEDGWTAEDINEEIGGIMSSGQGPSSWGYEALYGGWKGAWISELVSLLSPEEKKEVWKAMNTPEKIEIGTGEGDGTWLACEVEWFAELLGVKIKITKPSWEEEK